MLFAQCMYKYNLNDTMSIQFVLEYIHSKNILIIALYFPFSFAVSTGYWFSYNVVSFKHVLILISAQYILFTSILIIVIAILVGVYYWKS